MARPQSAGVPISSSSTTAGAGSTITRRSGSSIACATPSAPPTPPCCPRPEPDAPADKRTPPQGQRRARRHDFRWLGPGWRLGGPVDCLPPRQTTPLCCHLPLTSLPPSPCDMTSALFSPIRLADLELANRIVVSPMCQYSADDGVATDWHLNHLGMLANSGAGLVIAEMTDVERRGRISHGCPQLYSDDCEAALARRRPLPSLRHRQDRDPARPCRPQGLRPSPVGGCPAARAGCRSPAADRAVGDPFRRRLAGPARDDGSRYRADARGLRDRGQAGGARRFRRHRAACSAWLSASQLRLTDLEQAHRRLWRLACGAHALSARDRARGARWCRKARCSARA